MDGHQRNNSCKREYWEGEPEDKSYEIAELNYLLPEINAPEPERYGCGPFCGCGDVSDDGESDGDDDGMVPIPPPPPSPLPPPEPSSQLSGESHDRKMMKTEEEESRERAEEFRKHNPLLMKALGEEVAQRDWEKERYAKRKYAKFYHDANAIPAFEPLDPLNEENFESMMQQRPDNESMHGDRRAIEFVSKYPKKSTERGSAIKVLTSKGYISSPRTFYRHLKAHEENQLAEEKARGFPSSAKANTDQKIYDYGERYMGQRVDYLRESFREKAKWKGSIVLSLIIITFSKYEAMHAAELGQQKQSCDAIWYADDLMKQIPQLHDICGCIGNSDRVKVIQPLDPVRLGGRSDECNIDVAQDPTLYSSSSNFAQLCSTKHLVPLKWEWNEGGMTPERRWAKLYFSPLQFPPPATKYCDKAVFGRLRQYVENAASKGGSPVVCIGGNDCSEKRFKCKHWYRRREQSSGKKDDIRPYSTHSCTFSFVVRWDRFGYFIPLLNSKFDRYNLGCAWHSCPEPEKSNVGTMWD